MKVLSDKNFIDVITWTPSGRSFTIVNPRAFVTDILPEHFKSAKYSSFTRKLHRWGFQRHYRGEESGAFYHNDFLKDRLDLVEQMTCKGEVPHKAVSAIARSNHAPKNMAAKFVPSAPKSQLPERASVQALTQTAAPNIPIQAPLNPAPAVLWLRSWTLP